ncbi:MAG: hypothetical protein B6D64_02085 [Bacteroidetes bacterium 4484_276]|nr:MAG: hypothetical protein B6D64_02085 [Bacteroidetes bacterium 4484_276]OYT13469.1 MAG: hypothetical protein B6I19_04935 [Bacteroidetes bacterium 4572_114]
MIYIQNKNRLKVEYVRALPACQNERESRKISGWFSIWGFIPCPTAPFKWASLHSTTPPLQYSNTPILNSSNKANSHFLTWLTTFLVVLILLPQAARPQGHNQEVTIIAPYRPTISDAYKMALDPKIKDTVVEIPLMDYSIKSNPIYSPYEIKNLKPVFIEINPEEELRRNYLRAGFGNYTTPYVELFTNSLKSDEFSLGFHARHLSSKGEIEDYATSAFSQNQAALYGKRYLKNKILSGKVDYNRNVVHYYGFEPDEYAGLDISDDELKQRFSQIGANIGLASNYTRGTKMNYAAWLDFYHLSDLYETSEIFTSLQLNLNSRNEFFDFVNKQELGFDLNVDYYNNKDSLLSQGTTIAALKPYLNLDFEYLTLYLGVEGTMANDSSSNFYVFPEIKASYQVIPDYLRFYVSVTGGLHRNSFKEVSGINPWVNSIFPLGNTNIKYDIKGGLTGMFNQVMDYNFSVSYADIENMLFFTNDFFSPFSPEIQTNLANKFTGVYDNVKLTSVNLEVGYRQSGQIQLLFSACYRYYEMENEKKPWHKPAFEAKVGGKYFFNEHITFSSELFYNSKIFARAYENTLPTIGERSGFIDLNLGGEYRFNDRISAFVQLNNVGAVRYFRWYNYPSQRINLMGGLTFSF